MYAVVRTGGKQYKVSEGDLLRVEKLEGAVGETVELTEILMVGGDKVAIGTPLVPSASVVGKIVEQGRDKKILVFKAKLHGLQELQTLRPDRSPEFLETSFTGGRNSDINNVVLAP